MLCNENFVCVTCKYGASNRVLFDAKGHSEESSEKQRYSTTVMRGFLTLLYERLSEDRKRGL